MKKLLVKSNDEEVIKEAKTMHAEVIDKVEPLVNVETKEDEEKAVKFAENNKRLFVHCMDWKIIPLENLIAKCRGKTELIAVVKSADEAKLAFETMEVGADGVLLETDDVTEFMKALKLTNEKGMEISLEEAEVTKIGSLGKGSRSCIDTCSMMKEGQGMLVGSSSHGMILVQAEVAKNELAAPRPFRVNAGAVSLYTMSPEGKTNYIEEIKAGNSVMLVDRDGNTESSIVGRSKIEVRPMILVEVESNGRKAVAILQNAETIRIVTKDGSVPVTELKKGDKILAHFEEGGRHFGTLIKDETIVEQ